jgi:ABC-type multidrug transport system fused ATPase/permease subunit
MALSVYIRRFLALTVPVERRRLGWLLAGMVVLGFAEALGVSSVLPFIAVLANPEMVATNDYLARLYAAWPFGSVQNFLVYLALGALTFIVLVNAFALYINWCIVQTANSLGHSLSMRVIRGYLSQPYVFFLGKHSTNLALNTADEVTGVISGVVLPTLQLLSRLAVGVCLAALVVAVDPLVAGAFAMVFGGAYLLIFRIVGKQLSALGKQNQIGNRTKLRSAISLFQGIKDLKVLGRESYYLDTFERSSRKVAKSQARHGILTIAPRYIVETIGLGGMLAAALYLLIRERDTGRALPILALYALAAYRLAPVLQNVFASLTQIRFNLPSIELLEREMTALDVSAAHPAARSLAPLRQQIELRDVHFSYDAASPPVLRGMSLVVPKNATVGIVGTTGAGKTTLVDVLLGLIAPQEGALAVDGAVIDGSNAASWRAQIGYVPQFVYLSEESVAANIAFGISADRIDLERVRAAARIANIHDFIAAELPQGYDTPIGERGIRLSGGQRQRLGIARALYSDPPVLVLDEATSSLDSITEDAVIDAIRKLSHRKTIVAIAHRITTLQDCDVIHLLADGRVADSGSFSDLLERNTVFRAMAKAV